MSQIVCPGTGTIIKSWNEHLPCFGPGSADIYFTEEYTRLYENSMDSAHCFVYKEGRDIMLFPFLLRRVNLIADGYSDLETPYGYGGPIWNTADTGFIGRAFNSFLSAAREHKIIAGLIRFHPLLGNHKIASDSMQVLLDRKTIAMDLKSDREAIWKGQIHSKHRNSIRKAQKESLSFEVDEDLRFMGEFRGMYLSSMRRLQADEFYHFPDEYFKSLEGLKGHVFLGLIRLKGRIISGGIFMRYGCYGHYHLAATAEEFKELCPNNLLIFEVALYLKERGVELFHLGGGTNSDLDNSLFRFKRRFSDREMSFYIGKLIVDSVKYQDLCSLWEEKYPENKERYGKYVLKYRYH